jgi:hypothetical protein
LIEAGNHFSFSILFASAKLGGTNIAENDKKSKHLPSF